MAKSRFEYVRNFELPDPLLPNTFSVVRIDGRGFHKFSDAHAFEKPNDVRALDLMDRAARSVMEDLDDVVMAFGESDEYSFLIRRRAQLYSRRRSKINSTIVSIFTSSYVFYWSTYFPDLPLRYPPSFDSRVVTYPSEREVRDYFAWRQADTHINNLQNTSFWALVKSGQSTTEANTALQGTDSKDKNELLFKKFDINYNKLPPMFRKGSTLVRTDPRAVAEDAPAASTSLMGAASTEREVLADTPIGTTGSDNIDDATSLDVADAHGPQHAAPRRRREKKVKPYEGISGDVVVLHEDIIKDAFWTQRPWLLQ